MKKSLWKKMICLLLATLLLFSSVACNNSPTSSSEGSNEDPKQQVKEFIPSEHFAIVRGELYVSDSSISDACYLIKKAFKAAYGYQLVAYTDKTEYTNDSYEILVGSTNRPQSKKHLDQLYLNDYVYAIPSERVIVICGGTPEKTLAAAEQFCQDVLTYNGKKAETQNAVLKTGTNYTHSESYDYTVLTINDILWEDYTLAISSVQDLPGAISLMKEFGQYTGQTLPIILESEMTGEEESIIRIGAAYRDGKKSTTLSGYTVNSYVDAKGNVLCIEASNDTYYENAIAALASKGEKVVAADTVSYTFQKQFFYQTNTENKDGSNKEVESVQWDLHDEKIEQLGEGLTYTEQVFYDDRGLPHRVFTLVIDSNLYDFTMGSSKDGDAFTLPNAADRQTVEQHMQEALKNGKNVLAGVNGDQFYIDGRVLGDYRPDGLTIKNGKVISKGEPTRPALGGTTEKDRAFFGITKDGKPIIAMESEYINDEAKLNTLQTAIGANIKLAENGQTVYYKIHRNIGHGQATWDPRTVYGYTEDGHVILVCVDGRDEDYSNGAWLLQLSLLAHRFGASDLVQLDGGGSTCMVLRDPDTNVYTTVNKPSDGELRKVYNSLLVVKK